MHFKSVFKIFFFTYFVTTALVAKSQVTHKISFYQTSDPSIVLHESDDIDEMSTWINTFPITAPMTMEFNTSDVFLLSTTWEVGFVNNGFEFTIKSKAGQRAIFDIQKLNHTVMQSAMDHLTFDNVAFRNALIELPDAGGCIVRADGTKYNKFSNIIFDYGYCAMRATQDIQNLTIIDCVVRNVIDGAFRIGNGGIAGPVDVTNLIIKNIQLDDTANGGVIVPTPSVFNPFLLLKKVDNGLIENIRGTNNRDYHLGDVESSNNVTVNRVKAASFNGVGTISEPSTDVKIINSYFSKSSGASNVVYSHSTGLEVIGSTMRLELNDGGFTGIRNSVILDGINGTAPDPAHIGYEHDNVMGRNVSLANLSIHFTDGVSTPISWHAFNQSDWTKGANSKYIGIDDGSIILNADGSLDDFSLGRDMITRDNVSPYSSDINGLLRRSITDAGPFDGIQMADADLASLNINVGSLSPSFSSSTRNYNASLFHHINSLRVTSSLSDPGASARVQINNGTYSLLNNNSASEDLTLNVGVNTVNIKVTGSNNITTRTYTLNVSRAAQPFIIDPIADVSHDENLVYTSVAPTITGTPFGTVVYTLSGADSSAFTIDSTTGVVSMIARNFESPSDADNDNIYQISIVATDANGDSDTKEWKVSINDVIEISPITINSIANIIVNENSQYTSVTPVITGSPVGRLNFSLAGPDAGLFTVNASTGVVQMIARDFELPSDGNGDNKYEIMLIVTDDDGNTDSEDWIITIANVVEISSLTISDLGNVSVDENVEYHSLTPVVTGTPIGSLKYWLSGPDALRFTVNHATGAVEMVPRNFESPDDANADNVYEVILNVSDGDGNTDSEDWTVTVLNVTETASFSINTISNISVPENALYTSVIPQVTGTAIGGVAPANFTIIPLPDTQFYTSEENGGNNNIFKAQTNWVVANKAKLNIKYLVQLGDLVDDGENSGDPIQYMRADTAMKILENPVTTGLSSGIPYGVNVGNHDETPMGNPGGTTTFFNQYFGAARFAGRSYYGGRMGTTDNNNNYQIFSAGGMDFIAINLMFDPTANASVLTWADDLMKAFPQRKAIVSSHWILNANSTFSAQGAAIYNKLKANPNFFLMLCGHVNPNGESKRTDIFSGSKVHTVLSDYQDRPNGGSGWLRVMEFMPSQNKIYVNTYSPTLNQYELDGDSKFSLDFDMNSQILPGSLSFSLSGPDAPMFTINSQTGAVSMISRDFENPQDANGDNVYNVSIIATDKDGNTSTAAWAVTITDQIEPSTFSITGVSDVSVDENIAFIGQAPSITGTYIGNVTYSLSGADYQRFTINPASGVLSMIARNFEIPADQNADNSYDIVLIATDDDGNTASKALKITVVNVIETSLLTIAPIADETINENSVYSGPQPVLTGAAVGNVTYSIGGADATRFTINSANGVVGMVARDFERPEDYNSDNVYELTITAKDMDGNTAASAWKVKVLNVIENSSFSIGGIADADLDENTIYTSIAPSISGVPIGRLTYSMLGPDAGVFQINANTGVVTLSERNYDDPTDADFNNVYLVTLKATDQDGNNAQVAWKISINPSVPNAANSMIGPISATLTGNGLSTQTLTVTTKDATGDLIKRGEAKVNITKISGPGTLGPLVDNHDGTYTAIVTAPSVPGSGVFAATINGQPVKNSGLEMAIVTLNYSSNASLANSTIRISDPMISKTSSSIVTIQLKDAAGDNIRNGGYLVSVSTTVGVASDVKDNHDGTYSTVISRGRTDGSGKISFSIDGAQAFKQVDITVKNSTPVAMDDRVCLNIPTLSDYPLLNNDYDEDGLLDASTVDIDPAPGLQKTLTIKGQGRFLVSGSGLLSFTPEPGYLGDVDSLTYTVMDNNGAISNVATIRLVINVPPVINIAMTSETPSACSTAPFTFTASVSASSGAALFYQWKVDGTNVGTNSPLFSISNLVNGQSVVCLVTSTNRCAAFRSAVSNSINVRIPAMPIVNITANGPVTFFAGGSVLLTASKASDYSYRWMKNGVIIKDAQSSSFLATESGLYSVIINSGACEVSSAATQVTTIFSLPTNNFSVSVTAVSCKGSNNGVITLKSNTVLNYTATLSFGGQITAYQFTNSLEIKNLKPGIYSVCITIAGQSDYLKCYDLVVNEPKDLSLFASVNTNENTVNLNLAGGSFYNILLNGINYTTTNDHITLNLSKGGNSLKVSTDKECQGSIERQINNSTVYPNPVEDVLHIKIGKDGSSTAKIVVQGLDGRTRHSRSYLIDNGSVSVDVSSLDPGFYLVKLTVNQFETVYKIQKR